MKKVFFNNLFYLDGIFFEDYGLIKRQAYNKVNTMTCATASALTRFKQVFPPKVHKNMGWAFGRFLWQAWRDVDLQRNAKDQPGIWRGQGRQNGTLESITITGETPAEVRQKAAVQSVNLFIVWKG